MNRSLPTAYKSIPNLFVKFMQYPTLKTYQKSYFLHRIHFKGRLLTLILTGSEIKSSSRELYRLVGHVR